MAQRAVCEDIRTILHNGGKGTSGTDLFSFQWGSGVDGAEIDKQILVSDREPIPSLIKDEYENPVFEVLVRGTNSEGVKAVHDRARGIYEYLITLPRQTVSPSTYIQFAPVGGMIPLGRDDNNRPVFSMTFFTYRESIGV